MLLPPFIFAFIALLSGALGLTSGAAASTGTTRLLLLMAMVFGLLAVQGFRGMRKTIP